MNTPFLPVRERICVDDEGERLVLNTVLALAQRDESMVMRRDLYAELSGSMSKADAAGRITALESRGLVEAGDDKPHHFVGMTAAGLLASEAAQDVRAIVESIVGYFSARIGRDGSEFRTFESERLEADAVFSSVQLSAAGLVALSISAFGLCGSSSSSRSPDGVSRHSWNVPPNLYEFRHMRSWVDAYDARRGSLVRSVQLDDAARIGVMLASLDADDAAAMTGALEFRDVWRRSGLRWPLVELAVEFFADMRLVGLTSELDFYLEHDACRAWLKEATEQDTRARIARGMELPAPSQSVVADCRTALELLRSVADRHVNVHPLEDYLADLEVRARLWVRDRDPDLVADVEIRIPVPTDEFERDLSLRGVVAVRPIVSKLVRVVALLGKLAESPRTGPSATWRKPAVVARSDSASIDRTLRNDAKRNGEGMRARPQDTPAPLRANEQIGSWRLEKRLGAGGQGEVWRVRDANRGHVPPRAMKICSATDAKGRSRFAREANFVASLEHEHIVPIVDRSPMGSPGDEAASPLQYFVMPIARGSLEDAALERDTLTLLTLFRQACLGVSHLHRQPTPIFHRDLKPSNILVLDEHFRAVVADFGIAASENEIGSLTAATEVVGSPWYRAPEIANGDPATARSDIYGLGRILERILTGQEPSDMNPRSVTVRTRSLSAPAAAALDHVIRRAAASDPAHRFASVDEVIAAIPELHVDLAPDARSGGDTRRARPKSDVQVQVSHRAVSTSSERHDYELVVVMMNVSTRVVRDWQIDVELPTPIRRPVERHLAIVDARSGERVTFFRFTHEDRGTIRPNDSIRIEVPYTITTDVYYRHRDVLTDGVVRVQAYANDELAIDLEHRVSELQNF